MNFHLKRKEQALARRSVVEAGFGGCPAPVLSPFVKSDLRKSKDLTV
ncbi:hypothetical protein [Antarcticimicrobium sediminis]|nr:hypothetical protein [Antarcticimicrobium sediminis]